MLHTHLNRFLCLYGMWYNIQTLVVVMTCLPINDIMPVFMYRIMKYLFPLLQPCTLYTKYAPVVWHSDKLNRCMVNHFSFAVTWELHSIGPSCISFHKFLHFPAWSFSYCTCWSPRMDAGVYNHHLGGYLDTEWRHVPEHVWVVSIDPIWSAWSHDTMINWLGKVYVIQNKS